MMQSGQGTTKVGHLFPYKKHPKVTKIYLPKEERLAKLLVCEAWNMSLAENISSLDCVQCTLWVIVSYPNLGLRPTDLI